MATVTLMQFLQNDPSPFRYYHRGQSDTTTSNDAFTIALVNNIRPWPEFSLSHIMNQFGNLLNTVQIATDVQPSTPPPRFAAEDCLRELVAMYADRPVRRALALTFAHMAAYPGPESVGRTETTLGAGSSAILISNFVPDRAMYNPSLDEPINRLPGEIKPSWKWKWAWAASNGPDHGTAKARLSQLTFYMLQQGYRQPLHSGSRYGYMLTDQELVAFRKLDAQRTICMSQPVQWGGRQQAGPQRLTVLLALWYLGMLASDDDDWNLDAQAGDPRDDQLITQRQEQRGGGGHAARRR